MANRLVMVATIEIEVVFDQRDASKTARVPDIVAAAIARLREDLPQPHAVIATPVATITRRDGSAGRRKKDTPATDADTMLTPLEQAIANQRAAAERAQADAEILDRIIEPINFDFIVTDLDLSGGDMADFGDSLPDPMLLFTGEDAFDDALIVGDLGNDETLGGDAFLAGIAARATGVTDDRAAEVQPDEPPTPEDDQGVYGGTADSVDYEEPAGTNDDPPPPPVKGAVFRVGANGELV